ncbi:MAG TPA: hypothetical protein V6D29_20890 [Leptolyngbyaceae cyanobacterium]
MPRSPESSYISHRLPTGLLSASLTLGCWLAGFVHPTQATSAPATQTSKTSPQPAQTHDSARTEDNTSSSISILEAANNVTATEDHPTALVNSPSASPDTLPSQLTTSSPVVAPLEQSTPTLAQVPNASGFAPAGIPIPWNVSPAWMVPTSGQPGTVSAPMGTWVMVWLPYPSMPVPSAPNQGGGQPGAIASPVWSPFMAPAQMPLPTNGPMLPPGGYPPTAWGSPNSYPYSYPQPYPYQPYPYQPYAYQPYIYQPYAYGVPAGTPGNPYGMPMPQGASVTPSVPLYPVASSGNQPLAVPNLPSQQPGTVPPPPSQPIPIIPNASPGLSPTVPVILGSAPAVFPTPTAIAPTPTAQFVPDAPLSLQEATTPASNTAAAPLALPDDNAPLTPTDLTLQGLYVLQGSQSSARARLSGSTFLTPNLLVGGTLDLVSGPNLTSDDGVQVTELYLATALPGAPGLRFRLGQLDLTSYFDRNSFAKDIGRDFFNPVFNSNPALIAGLNFNASHPGGLVQWAINDDLSVAASAFSSAAGISGFSLDGFAGEVAFRTGDLILRGTYLTSRDSQFQGTGDRLNSYGVNAEWFIPSANVGLFGRYGRINNTNTGLATDTYSLGINALDLFMENDRLGLAYGRNLSTASVNGKTPDVLEVFYDFEALPNIRLGFTFQQLNQFTESIAGFRIRSDLNLAPSLSLDD